MNLEALRLWSRNHPRGTAPATRAHVHIADLGMARVQHSHSVSLQTQIMDEKYGDCECRGHIAKDCPWPDDLPRVRHERNVFEQALMLRQKLYDEVNAENVRLKLAVWDLIDLLGRYPSSGEPERLTKARDLMLSSHRLQS